MVDGFLYSGGTYTILTGPSGSDGTEAFGINDRSQIVGAYALPPPPSVAPLPAALPLFATGLAALGLLGWRRKRKNAAARAAA